MNQTAEPAAATTKALELSSEDLLDSFFHKLSQPLGALYGSLELGQLSNDAGELKAAIDAGLLQVERLMWLFQVTREFFGTDFYANPRRFFLGECVQSAVADAMPLAEAAGVAISVAVRHDSMVSADPTHLLHALENILVRSIRGSAQGSDISIELLARGDSAVVTISDQVPCSDAAAESTFEPFPPGAQIGPGKAGNLDLALSRRIIQAFAGDIRLRLTSLHTRQFEIVLPAA